MVRAILLLAALTWPPASRSAPGLVACDQARTVPVFVRETPEQVRLHIRLPPGGDPGAVEVRLNDRELLVLAQDADGNEVRSARISLRQPAVASGAVADYEGGGWLTITLRRKE